MYILWWIHSSNQFSAQKTSQFGMAAARVSKLR